MEVSGNIPDHQDWGGTCVHREAYDSITTHTEVDSLPNCPTVCSECSAALQEWIEWPCPRGSKQPPVFDSHKSVRCPVCGKVPSSREVEAAAALVLFMSPGGFA